MESYEDLLFSIILKLSLKELALRHIQTKRSQFTSSAKKKEGTN